MNRFYFYCYYFSLIKIMSYIYHNFYCFFFIQFLSILWLFGSAVTTIVYGQSTSFSRGYYSSVVTPTSRYSIHHGGSSSGGFVPLTYKSDLLPEESKHRSSSKYSKKRTYKGFGSVRNFHLTLIILINFL